MGLCPRIFFVSVINFTFCHGIGHCSGFLFNFRWIFIYWLINQLEFKLLALTWIGSVLFSSKYMCLILFSFFPFFICYAENGMYVVCDGFFYVFLLTVIFWAVLTVIFWAVALTPEYNKFVPGSSFDFLFDIENYVKRTGGALFCSWWSGLILIQSWPSTVLLKEALTQPASLNWFCCS